MNPATTTAAILGVSAVATVLIITNASTAGPLNPPPGPVAQTGPSLADIQSAVASIGQPAKPEWTAVTVSAGASPVQIQGSGVVRRVIITGGAGGAVNVFEFQLVGSGIDLKFRAQSGSSNPYAETFDVNAVYTDGFTATLQDATSFVVLLIEPDTPPRARR